MRVSIYTMSLRLTMPVRLNTMVASASHSYLDHPGHQCSISRGHKGQQLEQHKVTLSTNTCTLLIWSHGSPRCLRDTTWGSLFSRSSFSRSSFLRSSFLRVFGLHFLDTPSPEDQVWSVNLHFVVCVCRKMFGSKFR